MSSATPTSAGRLRAVREAQGRSLREVAAAAGLDPSALSRIERGQRQPTASTLLRICAALHLDKAENLLAALVPPKERKAS